ncbi:MAG: hypothetical protein KGP28_02760 [Bdellovibrionales bacterium]|nr:hypothetical protein [Bdellovibrionales bacterium]
MKLKLRWQKTCFAIGLTCLFWSSLSEAASGIKAAVEYPVAVGTSAQNFNSNLGFSAELDLDGWLAPWMRNYLSVGYASFSLRSDPLSSFRLIPVMVGIGLPGKVTDDLWTVMDLGLGGAFGYINAPGAVSYRAYGYFMMQVRGGIEYDFGSGFSAFARIPVNFILGVNRMTYLAYSGGLGFKF